MEALKKLSSIFFVFGPEKTLFLCCQNNSGMIPIVYKYGRISTFDMYASALYLNKNIPYFHANWSSGCCEVAAGDGSGFPPDNVFRWLEKWVKERSKPTNRWCSAKVICAFDLKSGFKRDQNWPIGDAVPRSFVSLTWKVGPRKIKTNQ